jgi:hypothetical protein
VEVGDEIERAANVFVLKIEAVVNAAQVVAQMEAPAGPHARHDTPREPAEVV